MSCVLRAAGDEFDVDAFLADCEVPPFKVFRRGQPRSSSKLNQQSGLNFSVSDAEMTDFDLQLEDATLFFREKREFVRRLTAFPGVEGVSIDFGVAIRQPYGAGFRFPPELVATIGDLGVELEISTYPTSDEE